jgi:RNA polymerase sigma-70 factor (ECF subfamily)
MRGPSAPHAALAMAAQGSGRETEAARRIRLLVHAHHGFVWRMLRRLGVHAADADDGAQQVFWVAARKIQLQASASDLPFLLAIALRVAADYRRARSRRREETLELPEAIAAHALNPEEHIERERALALADRLLESLPWDQRVVFVLFELEERSSEEIAALLEIPPGTVASRLRRGRAAFQQALSLMRLQGKREVRS